MKKIVVDLLGADHPQEILAKGALKTLDEMDASLILIGNESKILPLLDGYDRSRIAIVNADFTIENTQAPTLLLKDDGKSSISIAYNILKTDHEAVALVSAGNTGALLVGSIFRLGLIDGIKRPCLAAIFPNEIGKYTVMLDCGANLDCNAQTLLCFAHLGATLAGALNGAQHPSVALLSVGKEDNKGNLTTKEAFHLLKESELNFIGNVEGYNILDGACEVIVCDGFYGNIVLKNCEAIGKLAVARMKNALEKAGVDAKQAQEALHSVYMTFDYNSQAGGILLGAQKPIIKAHGAADENTMYSCVKQAYEVCGGNPKFDKKVN